MSAALPTIGSTESPPTPSRCWRRPTRCWSRRTASPSACSPARTCSPSWRRREARARLRGALVALACLGALSACGGDDVNTSTDPVEVEVGKAFEWNGFSVATGGRSTRSSGPPAGEVTTPEVKGTITNTSDEERTAIFELVFSADGKPLATVNCSAAKMATDQSQQFLCPGLGATMPEGYDAVVVQEFTRDSAPADVAGPWATCPSRSSASSSSRPSSRASSTRSSVAGDWCSCRPCWWGCRAPRWCRSRPPTSWRPSAAPRSARRRTSGASAPTRAPSCR